MSKSELLRLSIQRGEPSHDKHVLSEADKKLAEECGMELDVDVMLFFGNELAALLAKVREDERERCATECERMKLYAGGREESAVYNNVWEAAEGIRGLK